MPSKYRIILEMASQTARDIASNADRYTDFLITAANNYKYSFKEQLLIHAALAGCFAMTPSAYNDTPVRSFERTSEG